jgi:thiamine biosynthesis lipoprotein
LALAACSSPSPAPNSEFLRRSQPLLGTFVVINAYGSDHSSLDVAATAAFHEIRRVESLLTIHQTNSELARVNATAAHAPVRVSEELFFVVETALRIAEQTDGSFDVTIRPVADLWGFIWKEYRLPSAIELTNALRHVGFRHVELDRAQRTIRFRQPGGSIDLGGIGKGYAVDRALEILRQHGVTNALVRAGGDLRVIGAPPGESAWRVQIEDPAKSGQRTTIMLRDAAVSTSGNYENFFVVDGRRYAHVLNPRTGLPVENVAACSVIAQSCIESDAMATALMVLGPQRTVEKFAAKWRVRFVIADPTGTLSVESIAFPSAR